MKRSIIILFLLSSAMISCKDNRKTVFEKDSMNGMENMNDTSQIQSDKANSMMVPMMKQMEDMNNMKTMNDPDHDFAMMMKYHHTAAKEMAESELLNGHHAEVKSMARKMIAGQSEEIKEFDQFLKSSPVENRQGNDAFFKESMQMMKDMPMDMNKSVTDSDEQFIAMMIPHHQQAIDMSKLYLQYSKAENLKTIANKIITTQENEVKELKEIQNKSH
jgi:uncharacterized protein (DUF305 family)